MALMMEEINTFETLVNYTKLDSATSYQQARITH
jgi:hypothetical protein